MSEAALAGSSALAQTVEGHGEGAADQFGTARAHLNQWSLPRADATCDGRARRSALRRVGTPCPLAAEEIYDAATAAVAQYGLEGLSIDDVAARAGCSRATVYRRVGGREAILDAVVQLAIARITSAVSEAVARLAGEERAVTVVLVALATIRRDTVSAALLTGPAAAHTVSSSLLSEVSGATAVLSGLDPGDAIACEWLERMTLSLLCWPIADPAAEEAMIRAIVGPALRGRLR
ncbi:MULTISPECIES: TetR/AcrR family transcriptional regulator [unclassified Mycobacterium]|uniref:TetR/AcrR family transcriptional regulator n=1 Tax=unclassified Mycobacterium TaxID=2642494 RepID=UPI0029C70F7C|nr:MULTISPECIES: TetR/AcrR family transcriptional regulator [unclassified Mycobacterium]